MKLLKLTGSLLALACLSLSTVTAAEKTAKICASDKEWAEMAAISDLAEITLAKAALKNSENAMVKAHAQKMIDDHSKTTAELKKWAKTNDVDLKEELPAPKKAMATEITSKKGEEFDKAYMEAEIAGHRHAVVHFKNGSELNKDTQLKTFAETTLPAIQNHLAEVEKGHAH